MSTRQKSNVVLLSLYDVESFAVHTLHAVLKKSGFNVYSIFFKRLNPNNTMDSPTSDEINTLIKLIKRLGPILVGISVRSVLFKLACRVTEEIKKEVDALVIWGGVHPTIRPEQSIEFADIVCIGEGEDPIIELTAKLSKGEELDSIKNLWVRKGDKIIKNDLCPLIQALDSLPFPDFSNENKYLVENGNNVVSSQDPDKRTTYWIMTSRGCPFNCTYCCDHILKETYKDKGMYVRRRSIDNVIEELVQAKKRFKNLIFINFLDDVFTLDANWVRKFCEQYKKVVNLPFFCLCHPRTVNKEMIKFLKDAGVSSISMGVQTGSEKIRHKYFERYDTNEEIVDASQILHKYKINYSYSIIVDNPLETDETRMETFHLLLRLPRPFVLYTYTLTCFPETKLTKLLLEKGLISEDDVEDKKQKSYENMSPTLDLRRDKENLFWCNLYFLIQKKYIPKRFIVWLSRIKMLKRYPKLLTLVLRSMSSEISTVRKGSKADMIRRYLMRVIYNPHLLFKKAWFLLKIMIKKLQFRLYETK